MLVKLVALLALATALTSAAQDDCFDYDTDYVGNDLEDGVYTPQGSPEACQSGKDNLQKSRQNRIYSQFPGFGNNPALLLQSDSTMGPSFVHVKVGSSQCPTGWQGCHSNRPLGGWTFNNV